MSEVTFFRLSDSTPASGFKTPAPTPKIFQTLTPKLDVTVSYVGRSFIPNL